MTPIEIFERWSPSPERGGTWSPWAKPVLFAHLNAVPFRDVAPTLIAEVAERIPELPDRCTVIVDLPGAASIYAGFALWHRGFQAVPLFNTSPGPSELVDLDPLISALVQLAPDLGVLPADGSAPPAFLIDAQRLSGERSRSPGNFDNRWVVFPQDFPSGAFLRSRGLESVVVLRKKDAIIRDDLEQVLRLWRRAGLRILWMPLERMARPQELLITPAVLAGLRSVLSLMVHGLRRNSAGGFGARIPEQSTGSGGYA